jgi:hypothetical protein
MSIHDESWDRPTCEHCNQEIVYGGRTNHTLCRFQKYIGKQVQLNVKLAAMPPFWFSNIVKDAQEFLKEGEIYTVKAVHPASSWCAVELEEIPNKEFALSWFDVADEPNADLIGSWGNLEW